MTSEVEQICAPSRPISENLDRYLALRGVDKKKYYAKYLIAAGKAWEELFQKTLWVVKSVWLELHDGDPYPFIKIPRDCLRWFSATEVDKSGNMQQLYYNSQLNIIPKPTTKKCGCSGCDCGGLCEDVNSFTLTTKLFFTINGVDYYEKTWLKYCPNGDILEYKETPVKKYNDFVGDGGDFNSDFNDDFLIGASPLSNFNIVTQTSQRKICALTVRPCGCPEDTQQNEQVIMDFCSCFLPIFSLRRHQHRKQYVENTNNNFRGEIKISECGTKIYFKHSRHWKKVSDKKFPEFLLFNYQTNGRSPNSETLVPDYAEMALWKGTDYFTKMFNNTYSWADKQAAKYEYESAINDIILFLSPIDFHFINNIQDEAIRW